ncbi:MAG: hypothetical protein H6826_13700 [Planctomycetes bacterium]|nr:hypothetical protein [Planctomycetota bacterium]
MAEALPQVTTTDSDADCGPTFRLPDVPGSGAVWPSAAALHEVAPVLDQTSDADSPAAMLAGLNDADTVTEGGGGGGGGSTVTVTATPVDVLQV